MQAWLRVTTQGMSACQAVPCRTLAMSGCLPDASWQSPCAQQTEQTDSEVEVKCALVSLRSQ